MNILIRNFLILISVTGAVAGAVFSCETGPSAPPGPPPDGMVWIAGEAGQPGFYLEETEVTVADFGSFVRATNYVTEAEDFGWSGVFNKDSLAWLPVEGATWKFPLGPDSLPAAADQPVVQLSMRDVTAYAEWRGREIPTAEEWQFAATQSDRYRNFPWGEEMLPGGVYRGNWWQGYFPYEDLVEDGFPGIAAVKQFPPAENGLYDIAGNVWEWTATKDAASGQYIIKGGSFLCSTSYCTGFNLQQQQLTPSDSGLNHLGFRCILR